MIWRPESASAYKRKKLAGSRHFFDGSDFFGNFHLDVLISLVLSDFQKMAKNVNERVQTEATVTSGVKKLVSATVRLHVAYVGSDYDPLSWNRP